MSVMSYETFFTHGHAVWREIVPPVTVYNFNKWTGRSPVAQAAFAARSNATAPRNSSYSYVSVLPLSVRSNMPRILPEVRRSESNYKQQLWRTVQRRQRGWMAVVNIYSVNAAPTSHHYPGTIWGSIKCKSKSLQFCLWEIYTLKCCNKRNLLRFKVMLEECRVMKSRMSWLN